MKVIKNYIIIFTFIFINSFILKIKPENLKHYYCTPSDEKHYHMLKNLIGSIHNVDFANLEEIAVFDLGLNNKQIIELKNMQKVNVYQVEKTNPDILKYFVTSPNGRKARGYFAWKPVVIKQALDMFPYVLYLDSGTTVLKPLNNLFEYIKNNEYFLLSCTASPNCNISNRITKTVLEQIISKLTPEMQTKILDEKTIEIDAGLQGLSRQMLNNYVLPMYNHSKNLDLFKDDGTAKFGYGAARHDQSLFSIHAHCLNLNIFPEGWLNILLNNKLESLHIHWNREDINANTSIYRSRGDINFQGGKTKFIKFKNK